MFGLRTFEEDMKIIRAAAIGALLRLPIVDKIHLVWPASAKAASIIAFLALSACAVDPGTRAVNGAAIGAGTGCAMGALATVWAGPLAVAGCGMGAAMGAVGGASMGAATTPLWWTPPPPQAAGW